MGAFDDRWCKNRQWAMVDAGHKKRTSADVLTFQVWVDGEVHLRPASKKYPVTESWII